MLSDPLDWWAYNTLSKENIPLDLHVDDSKTNYYCNKYISVIFESSSQFPKRTDPEDENFQDAIVQGVH